MAKSKTPSEPEEDKGPPPQIHAITFKLNDPNHPPESLEIDSNFFFKQDLPLLKISAGDRIFGFDKEETQNKSLRDLMTLIARWPKSFATDAQLFC